MKAQNRPLWDKARDAMVAAALAAWTTRMMDKSARRQELRNNQNERVQPEVDNTAPVEPRAHV